ncbi:MAG: CPBP family intramembrane metalloprotease domain-containing protein, partial [Acidothermus sp.]|nr:CPBP family intramembrane metalloprotease domain-containing protein [Acidothermus sp.]
MPQRVLRAEVWLVFALSLGASAVGALLNLVDDLTKRHAPLASQHTV